MKRTPRHRPERLAALVHETLATALTTSLKDPRIGFVTITGVRTSPDLRTATVYFSVLDNDDRDDTLDGFKAAHHRIQRAIANQAHLKYTPVLEFEFDEALERGLRISQLLHELEVEENE